MKYAYEKICINPNKPYIPVGFITAETPLQNVRGNLNAHLIYFDDNKTKVVILCLDNCNIVNSVITRFENCIQKHLGLDVQVIVSATHTHFAPSLSNLLGMVKPEEEYVQQILDLLDTSLTNLQIHEGNYTFDYHHKNFDELGKSRLSSGNNENIYAGVLTVFEDDNRILNLIFYNCHPTISAENCDYLSPDYPGYTIDYLQEEFVNDHFIFFNGACGDVSTRFTRKEKSYDEALRLSKLIANCFKDLLLLNKPNHSLELSIESIILPITNECKDIDIDAIDTSGLQPKEIREIETARKARPILEKFLPFSEKEVTLTSLSFGGFNIIFNPFELFSSYNELIDKNKTFLAGYSQGAKGYLTRSNHTEISYEFLIETPTHEDKVNIENIISKFAK